MPYKIKNQVSEALYQALSLMLDKLGTVYRFSGKYTRVSTPNSVKDHVVSLYILIDEIFEGMPEEYDFIKLDMYMRATVHDLGELLGEFGVLETQLLEQGLSESDKKEAERIVFEYFITQAIICVAHGGNRSTFFTLVDEVSAILKEGIYASRDSLTLLRTMCVRVEKYNALPELYDIKKYYKHIIGDISYAGRLFNALDLIDGNEYYINNASSPENVPDSLHRMIHAHCKRTELKLSEAEKHNSKKYDDLTAKVVNRMQDNMIRYQELIRTSYKR
jgi:hypothetical protein